MPISRKQAKLREQRDSGNDFDVLPHDHTHRPDPEPMIGRKRELRDHERGIGLGLKPHPKRMPMQAAPDHGDHYE